MDRNPFHPDDAPVVLPRGPHGLDREVVLASQRGRLLSAFVALAAERGAHAVSISDVVRAAGTAKRTFYEHFSGKQDCFVQAYEIGAGLVADAVTRAVTAVADPGVRVRAATRAYLEALAGVPDFGRLLLTQMWSGGDEVAARWIASQERLADEIVRWRAESRQRHPELPELDRLAALGTMAAVNEIAAMRLHTDGIAQLPALADDLGALAVRMLAAPPA